MRKDDTHTGFTTMKKELIDHAIQGLRGKVIYCDGSGNNGFTSGYCVLVGDHVEHKVYRGSFTNNEMEWLAMIRALMIVRMPHTVASHAL